MPEINKIQPFNDSTVYDIRDADKLSLNGGTMTGTLTTNGLIGTENIEYGAVLPLVGEEGQFFFQLSSYNSANNELDKVYPIGAIYMSVNNISPEILFGGTWEQIQDTFLLSAGSTYTAGNTGGSATVTLTTTEIPSHSHGMQSHTHNLSSHYHYVPAQNGSAARVSLTGHVSNFALQAQGTAHLNVSGVFAQRYGGSEVVGYATASKTQNGDGFTMDVSHSHSVSTNAVNSNGPSNNTSGGPSNNTTTAIGSSGAHNNMPPYLVVYMWKRVA